MKGAVIGQIYNKLGWLRQSEALMKFVYENNFSLGIFVSFMNSENFEE